MNPSSVRHVEPVKLRTPCVEPQRGPARPINVLPGIIAGLTNTDVAAVVTFSAAGAAYGLSTIKFQVLCLPFMYFFQELGGRLGAHLGVGMFSLIEHVHGRNACLVAFVCMTSICCATLFCEFAGIAAIATILGIPPYSLLLTSACGVAWATQSHVIEHVALALGGLLSFFIVLAILSCADQAASWDNLQGFDVSSIDFDELLSATLGASLTPFLLFYQCSAAVNGKVTVDELGLLRTNIMIGVSLSLIASVAITTAAATEFWAVDDEPDSIATVEDAGTMFTKQLGPTGKLVFCLGVFGAAITAALCTLTTFSWAFDEVTRGTSAEDVATLLAYKSSFSTDEGDEQRHQTLECDEVALARSSSEEQAIDAEIRQREDDDATPLLASSFSDPPRMGLYLQDTSVRLLHVVSPKSMTILMITCLVAVIALTTSSKRQVKLTIMAQDLDSIALPPTLFLGVTIARALLPRSVYSDREFKIQVHRERRVDL